MRSVHHRSISTGNEQIDEILKGGFPANSINLIMGEPGTGKTVFAEQMVFHHAQDKDDRSILYLMTLSEPVAKVLTYLQRFTFFDEDKIGTKVHYEDIGFKLAESGIECLVPHIKEAIHSIAPKLIIIDSFRALHDLSNSVQDMRRMLFDLTGMLTSYETTVFLVGEYTDEDAKILPEFAIADGIVQFLRNSNSTRDERFMRVLKLRGSGYLEGLHGCRITSAGLEVYPRLVTPDVPRNYSINRERIPSGVEGLDKILGGGFLKGSTTVVAGPTGSGKTTLSLQFALAGATPKEKSLYVSFQENPIQLYEVAQALAKERSADAKGLDFLYASPVELQIDSLVVKMFWRIQDGNIKRVVIDSIGDLGGATNDPMRLHNYLYSMIQHFAVAGVTSILTFETLGPLLRGAKDKFGISHFSNMSDNIILLTTPGEPDYDRRDLRCLKARSSQHEHKPHPFVITQSGLEVL